MSPSLTTIPLCKLTCAKTNARKTQAKMDIKGLAASIVAHGLLQNLAVRSCPDADKGNGEFYEVVAGGRRLAALKLLAKRKTIDEDFPVPCTLIDGKDDMAVEASLAENVMRTPLHPADQFEAFSKLADEGHGPEAIAARFGVTPATVRQRLKLAAVSPKLIRAYREDAMSLDQLMAFAISDDREAQEQVWSAESFYEKTPHAIRRALTRSLVEGSDRRARFVGAKAYEAAGGTIVRDLFDEESEGYFEDSQLLDRLAAKKLEAEAGKVKAEGWSWVEPHIVVDYDQLSRFGRIAPGQKPLSKTKQKKLDRLCERYDTLIETIEDEGDEETAAELDRLSEEIEALTAETVHWAQDDLARAGAMVSLDHEGRLAVTRGLVRVEETAARSASAEARATEGETESKSSKERSGHSEALIEELSAHKTAALQETLAGKPDVALTALLHALVLRTFFGEHCEACVDIRPSAMHLGSYAEGIGESPAAAAMAERHKSWAEQLPPADDLWDWLSGLDRKRQLQLLANCAAQTVNGLQNRRCGNGTERLRQAEMLAKAVSLDMSKWWQVTRESYLDRVTKQQILDAVSEAVSVQAAENIASLKKSAMAARAEKLLAGSGWLPEPLRTGSFTDVQH